METTERRATLREDSTKATVARLVVEGDDGGFGLDTRADGYLHRLGLSGAPVYDIHQPLAPDEGWNVTVNPRGKFLEDHSFSDPSLERVFATWNRESRSSKTNGILEMLPRGEYRLIRSKRTLERPDPFYLGNEDVPLTPNLGQLVGDGPVHVTVVGAPVDRPPNLDGPLIGLVLLNYLGDLHREGSTDPRQHGVMLFPFLDGRRAAASATGDLVVVVPEDGPLVIDNLAGFSAEDEAESRRLWKDNFVDVVADALSGNGPTDGTTTT